MASQLGRQYGPPQQNCHDENHVNTHIKSTESMRTENRKGDLLVKQTYWDYDDFMNTNIRNPTKKCYYEMMSRDEFNNRQDFCKDLEMKRNNIIEKLGRDVYGSATQSDSTEDNVQQCMSESANARYIGPQQMSSPDMEHTIPPLQSYQPQMQPLRNQPRPVDRESSPPTRPSQNPRPRSVPYHMRSGANFQPRPGPGVVQATSPPPPNEASNIYYTSMQEKRVKPVHAQNQSSPQLPHGNEGYGSYNTATQNPMNEKYYDGANVRPKQVRRINAPPQVAASGRMHPHPNQYVPPPQHHQPNSPRYQYLPAMPDGAVNEARLAQMVPPYEANNQTSPNSANYAPKTISRNLLCHCPSSCSCSIRDYNIKQPKKTNNRFQSAAQRQDSDRHVRATSLESVTPQSHYPAKQETPNERNQMRQPYNNDLQSGQRQMINNRPPQQPQYEEPTGNARPVYSGGSSNSKQPLFQPNIANVKSQRPNHMMGAAPQAQNFNYPPQANVSQQIGSQSTCIQPHSVNGRSLPANQQKSQPQHRQFSNPAQPPPPQSITHSEPIQTSENDGYDDYYMDYHRMPNNGKQLYVTMPPPKPRAAQTYSNATGSQGARVTGNPVWNDMNPGDYGYSDTDVCDLEEEEEEDDDNSW